MTMSPSLLTAMLLLGGILPLAVGPFLAQWAERSNSTKAALDAFIAVSLGGIVILHLWPHAFIVAGGWALVGGLAGLLLPFFLHGPLHNHERKIYPAMVAIAFLGLAVHATLDGVALLSPVLAESAADPIDDHAPATQGHDHDHTDGHDHADDHPAHGGPISDHSDSNHSDSNHNDDESELVHHHHHAQGSAALLALAVILHRLPMGIAVWWLVVPILGRRVAIALLCTLAAATVIGFGIASQVLVSLSIPGIAIFEATIAGMLLHVVMGHEHSHGAHSDQGHQHSHGHGSHHHHHHSHPPHEDTPWISALGALAGAGLVVVLCQVHPMEQRFERELSFGEAFRALSIHLAPLFILGAALEAVFRGIVQAPRVVRAESPWATALVSLGLLGWQWTIPYAVGVAGALLIVGRSTRLRGTGDAAQGTSRNLLQRFEHALHGGGLWLWAGIGIAALLEPILRVQPSPGFALAVAALLGFLCCRHPLLGLVLAFFLLHMDWPSTAVMCFLLSGALARLLRELSVARKTALFAGLGLLPLIWVAQFLPRASADFHGLAENGMAPWQLAAIATLVTSMTVSLFSRGFRGFLWPLFGLEAEPRPMAPVDD